MARLYADENVPLPVVESLRELGHFVLTMQESGRAGQGTPDAEVLSFATAQGLILITLNRSHFMRLHRDRPDHAGIIVCTFDPDFVAQTKRIHEALGAESSIAGKLLRVNRPAR